MKPTRWRKIEMKRRKKWNLALLELIKMDIHDYRELLKTELITTIQIHLYEAT